MYFYIFCLNYTKKSSIIYSDCINNNKKYESRGEINMKKSNLIQIVTILLVSAMVMLFSTTVNAANDNNEVHINISGMGVMRYAKRKENAIKLLEWLSSSKGQQLFANINMEYPVNKDVLPHPLLQKWGSFKSSKINVRKAGELQALAIKLTQEISYE